MKNASMNRQSLVSIFTVMLLVFSILGILFSSLFLIGCGGDEEEDTPEASVGANPLVEKEPEPPLNDRGACAAGMTLKPGDSCSYVAGEVNVVFFVQQDGSACREGGPVIPEVFGGQVRVDNFQFCRNDNIERDDAFKSDFAANKNPDGSWTVNGLPSVCEIPPLNEDWGGEPVLFSPGREDTGAILLSEDPLS